MQQNQDSSILSDLKGEGKGKEAGEAGKEVETIFEQVFVGFFCYFSSFSLVNSHSRLPFFASLHLSNSVLYCDFCTS